MRRLGLVVGAGDRARHVLGAGRHVPPDRILAGEPLERSPGQERLERDLAAVLLPDDDHERRAAVAGVGDRVDRVAQPGGRVQVDERGLAAGERVAGRHPHDRALVEAEHEPDVGRQVGQERDLGRARVAEDRRHPVAAHDLERGIADGHARPPRRRCHCPAPAAVCTVVSVIARILLRARFASVRMPNGRREGIQMTDKPSQSSDFVQSLERGLAVIRAFDAEHRELALSEVARSTGLTRAAARRFLLTLVKLGYVNFSQGRFSLRPRVLELGYAYLSSLSLPEVAMPHMEALVAEVNESCSISVLDETDIVYVARVPTRRIMSITLAVGTRLPAFVTSMGRVLLAGLPDDELEERLERIEVVPLTSHTVKDMDALRTILAAFAGRATRPPTRSSRRDFARWRSRFTTRPAR